MPGMTISRSTRSGGLFSMLRRAAVPSTATLSLYSSRRACTRMSIFVFASSTMSTRLAERSFTSVAPGSDFERALQLRLGILEGIALDTRVELYPARRVEQGAEGIAMCLDEVDCPGIGVRQQRGELRRGLSRLGRARRRRWLNRR